MLNAKVLVEPRLSQESQRYTDYLPTSIEGKVREVLMGGEGGRYTDFQIDDVMQNVMKRRNSGSHM